MRHLCVPLFPTLWVCKRFCLQTPDTPVFEAHFLREEGKLQLLFLVCCHAHIVQCKSGPVWSSRPTTRTRPRSSRSATLTSCSRRQNHSLTPTSRLEYSLFDILAFVMASSLQAIENELAACVAEMPPPRDKMLLHLVRKLQVSELFSYCTFF